jgi:putative oxidoreductase
VNNGGTAAILFCFACLYLWTAGGGALSVDAALEKRSTAPADDGAVKQATR